MMAFRRRIVSSTERLAWSYYHGERRPHYYLRAKHSFISSSYYRTNNNKNNSIRQLSLLSSTSAVGKRCYPERAVLLLDGSSNNNNKRFFTTAPSNTNNEKQSTNIPSSVRIGHVELPLKHGDPQHRYRIPHGYLPKQPSNTILKHLQWMMAKDNLKQDMLLVGPPGAGSIHRRRLAMMYAEMTQQQVEILTLSSDITESDLKQRRELISPTAPGAGTGGGARVEFVDQPPVRAALHGRLLILDGLDKAERNVLPTLNNLLENREMNLEDGRFLVSPERFVELSAGGIIEESSSFLVPTHENFRVIALAVPSPPYDGRSLDPPLRSRFQIRRVDNDTTDETFEALIQNGISEDNARVCSVLPGAMEDAARADVSSGTRILHFPLNATLSTAKVMENFPLESPRSVISRVFPYGSNEERIRNFLAKRHQQSQETFDRACKEFDIVSGTPNTLYEIEKISSIPGDKSHANVSFSAPSESLFSLGTSENNVTVTVPCGGNELHQVSKDFVETVGSKSVLSAMVQEHFAGRDILLTSPKGEGKSATAAEFSSILGYDVHLFSLYKEMTGRDLLMRRTTDSETGETGWDESPLLTAATKGQVCILDGIEKLNSDTLGTLHGFLTDREVYLPDGRKIAIEQRQETSDEHSVDNIHPSFRVVALGSFSNEIGSSWITEEVGSMFSIIPLNAPSRDCLKDILMTTSANTAVPNELTIDKILDFSESLTKDVAADCGVSPLSTRNLIRLAKGGDSDLHGRIWSVLVADLVPPRQRSVLDSLLRGSGILPEKQSAGGNPPMAVKVTDDKLTIGDFSMERRLASRPEMVPSPHFFDIPNHVWMIKTLLGEWEVGERSFLLLGNQGVGKNKVVDRLCELANFEREYIQLHRDSSISSLTLSPTIEDGKVIWKDSPLVRAVTKGCALVIDEADKAPLEVISVLKSLVQDGELLLADGRRISRKKDSSADTIQIHPDFTVFVLANRPGFPFHGNDFFSEIGDCFSSHIIPNPDLQSEINLLRSYAPNVDELVLRKIAASFSNLRYLFEHGDITYPYSTREAVSVVRHIEQYPNESLVTVLHNVLDMDSFNAKLYSQLAEVFREHGFPIKASSWKKSQKKGKGESDELGIEYLADRSKEGTSATPPPLSAAKFGKWDDNNDPHVGGNQWAGGTGGSDTAGLGGRGGPFRLDRGHKVHQVSDEAKAQVSMEAAAAARKMAEKALKERLKEIGMSGTEFAMYKEFVSPITGDITSLRATLQAVEFKSSERDWIKRQSYGEVDDSRLVEGVAGEKYIYKRRGTVENQLSHSMKRPRRIRFVMDCSGSMYRFNGYDQRQQRCLEAAALVMEAFEGMEKRFDYSIVGHSGDSRCIKLVNFGEPPTNEKERMRILQTMVAHSQYCQSGDNTLGAIKQAIVDVTKGYSVDEENDEDCMVIAVSDANLARYGISPRELARAMTDGSSDSKAGIRTKAFCVFIASFGSEADDIRRELPLGRGFVCMQTNELPKIVKHILTSEIG